MVDTGKLIPNLMFSSQDVLLATFSAEENNPAASELLTIAKLELNYR